MKKERRSDNQGGFSSVQNPMRYSAETEQAPRKFVEKAFLNLTKRSSHIKGDKKMIGKLAKDNDMTLAEAQELVGDSVRRKSRHRFFGNMMHRMGVEGYEKNLDWVLRHYFSSASRYPEECFSEELSICLTS